MAACVDEWETQMNKVKEWDEFYQLADQIPEKLGITSLFMRETKSKIAYADWNICFKKDYEANRKGNFGRDDIQIIFVTNQNCFWEIEGRQKVYMNAGEICAYCNSRTDISKMTYEKDVDYRFISMTLTTEDFEKWIYDNLSIDMADKIQDLFLGEFQILKSNISDKMYNLIDEINRINVYSEFSDALMECKVKELLLISLYQLLYNPGEEVRFSTDSGCKEKNRLYRLAQKISIHPQEEYVAGRIAEEMNISVSKFNREFRQQFGTSLHAYVIEKRLAFAAALLREGYMSVSEAAYSCGYTNMSHFTKSFMDRYNVLPKDYKKNMSEKC